ARGIGQVLPFYYTTGLPTEIMIGRIAPGHGWGLIGIQAVWAIIGFLLWRTLYKNGLKHYTGVGM
ncbi:multidrug ABC transporter permease, partial [bacterium]